MSQPEGAEPPVPVEEARPEPVEGPALSAVEGARPVRLADSDVPFGEPVEGTRQERRSRKKKKERERMPQHGKGLAQIYKDAVTKRSKNQDSLEG